MVVVSSSFTAPAQGVLCEQPSTKLLVNDQEIGTATLFITENNVIWGGGVLTAGGSSPNLCLQYRTISLHAVQREPSPALYMLLNYALNLQEFGVDSSTSVQDDDGQDQDFDPEESPVTQLRFVPQNENDLGAMYSAMSQGQSLHPDPQDDIDDDYMDGEEFDEGDENAEIYEDAEESNPTPEDATSRLRQMRLENSNGHNANEDSEEFEETYDNH